jgi:hypothetical protein
LFDIVHWHRLAKLCMHNDLTLNVMDAVTVSLSEKLRAFTQSMCPAFEAKELHREFNVCVWCESKKTASKCHRTAAVQNTSESSSTNQASFDTKISPAHPTAEHCRDECVVGPALAGTQSSRRGQWHKTFNLTTYKLHSLGDYVKTIRHYGTTDSFSTEPVHCVTIFFFIQMTDVLPTLRVN